MSKEIKLLTVAYYALAAQILDSGQTVHSDFLSRIPVYHHSSSYTDMCSALADKLCNISLLTWENSVITIRYNLEAVVSTFKAMMRSTFPFCGKFILCVGDFRLTLPVVRAGNQSQ